MPPPPYSTIVDRNIGLKSCDKDVLKINMILEIMASFSVNFLTFGWLKPAIQIRLRHRPYYEFVEVVEAINIFTPHLYGYIVEDDNGLLLCGVGGQ